MADVLPSPLTAPDLGEREIHIWGTLLDRPRPAVERLTTLLSGDEMARARRFHFERDRNRFVVGRAELRRHLATYVHEDPSALRFSYTDLGKPSLSWPSCELSFNVTHSEELALFACCRDAEVGIDVERVDDRPVREGIAEKFFSPAEVRVLQALDSSAQPEAFLRCWTRKEAYLKARGDGLTLALDSFDVTFAPGDDPRLLRSEDGPEETRAWSFFDVSASFPGYIAAVAVRGAGWSFRVLAPAVGAASTDAI